MLSVLEIMLIMRRTSISIEQRPFLTQSQEVRQEPIHAIYEKVGANRCVRPLYWIG